MATVQQISSASEIPSGQHFILVTIGDKNEMKRQGGDVFLIADRALPDNEFEAHVEKLVSDAQLLAIQERIETIYIFISEPKSV